ncbi:YadA-like family protein [Rodentibacter abscessus]|uniref:YadA-like family protein n=1 Tax=Rodentibacter abscessus TaxID=3381777 RepID=UPI003CCCB73A
MAKGFGLKAADGQTVTHKLGEAIEVVGGNSNINTTVKNGKVQVNLNNSLDLSNAGSVKTGDTTLNNSGLTISGGPSVTKNGIDAGSKKITNVSNGTDPNDAVNFSQLNATNNNVTNLNNTVNNVNATVNKGWNINTTASEGGNVSSSKEHNVKMGDTVTIDAGKNINITQSNGKISIATSDTPNFTGVNTQNLTLRPKGNVDFGGNVLHNVAAPVSDTDAANKKYVDDGRTTVNSSDKSVSVNGTGTNPKNYDLSVNMTKVANDVKLKYSGDNNTSGENSLSNRVNFKGSDYITTKASNGEVAFDLTDSTKNKINNAMQSFTVGGIAVDGKNLESKEIKNGNKVNFKENAYTMVTIESNDNGANVSITPVLQDLNVNVTTGEVSVNATNSATHPDGFATAKQVADAINKSGWTAKVAGVNDGERDATSIESELINPGDVLTYQAGKNLKVKQESGKITYSTKDNVSFSNVTVGDVVINNQGINAGNKAITNVANGTNATDAVNLSQLNASTAAAKTEVKQGNNVVVNSTKDADGHTIYTVHANSSSVSKGSDKIIVNGTYNATTGITDYSVDLSKEAKDQLAKEESVSTDSSNLNVSVNATKNATGGNDYIVRLNNTLNLTKDGSVTIGDTKLDNNGLTITGGPNVTKDGIDAGDKKITNVSNGTVDANSKDAVNGSQLYATNQNVTNITNEVGKGWNLTTSKSGSGNAVNSTLHNVKMGETVTLDAGNNINITQTNGTISISTSDTPTFANITVKDGKDGKDGASVVINGKDGTIGANGKDGTGVVLNGKDGTIGINGKNGVNATLTVAEGQTTVNPKDNGQNITRIVYNTTDASGNTVTREVATLDDGLKFKGDNDTVINRTLGSQLNITGGADTANLTDNNIGVVGNASGDLVLKLNKNLNLTKDGSVVIGNSTLNDGGLTITGGPSITQGGIDAGDKKITNVTDGDLSATSKDAVNGSQLYATNQNVTNITNEVGKGWNLTTSQSGSGNAVNSTLHNVKMGETVTLDAGNNINITQNGSNISISTSDTPNFSNITVGKDGKDGQIGINGKDGASANITVANGSGTLDDSSKGGDGITRIVYNTTNSDGSTTTREVATKDDGLIFQGDNGKAIKKKLGETLNITGGVTDENQLTDNNIGIINKDGNLTVKLNKDLNLTKDGSVTIGNTTLNNDGLNITGGPSITQGGINAGDKKITNVSAGNVSENSTDAVNGGQLYTAITNSGFNLTTKAVADSNGQASADGLSDDDKRIATNETFTLGAGNNIVIKQIANGYEIATSNNITVGAAGKDGKPGVDGTIGVNGKDGASVVINGKDGSIGLTGPKGADGKDGASATLQVVNGTKGLDGNDGKDGESKTRIEYTKPNGDKEEVATLKDGLVFKGDNDAVINRTLNSQLDIVGGAKEANLTDNNIGVIGNANGTMTIKLNKDLNLTENGSVNLGDTVLNSTGLTITNGPKVTKDGIDAGDKKITNVTNGTVDANSKDAVNGSQLYATNQNVTNITNEVGKGWNLTTSKSGSGNAVNSTLHNVKMGETVTLDAGNNINITQTNGTISISTSDTPTFANITVKDGKDGKDGASVVINGKDGSIGLTGPKGADGSNGTSATIQVVNGTKGLDGNDGVNGESKTRIEYVKPDGNKEEIATLKDGLVFKGDNDTKINRTLNSRLDIVGGAKEANLTANNIGVIGHANGTMEVKLNKDLNLTDKGSISIGNTTLNNEGLTINGGPNITQGGIDAGNKKITNVADGNVSKDSKDAINGGQLYSVIANTGFNLASKAVENTTGTVSETTGLDEAGKRILTNETFNLDAGNNIVIKQIKDGYEVATAENVTFTNITVGKDGKDGTIGVNGKDGTGVVLNGKDGVIGINGKDGVSANITVANGSGTLDADDKGGKGITRIVYNTTNEDGSVTTREVATKDDGLVFQGDNGDVIKKKLGQTLNITGGVTEENKLTDNNIGVVSKDGNLTVKLNKDLNLTKDGSVTIGDVNLSNGGLSINGGPSINKDGIDAGDKKITNVTNGTVDANSKDAVNGSQLYATNQNVTNITNEVGKGWNLTTSKSGSGNAVNSTLHNVKMGETVTLDAGNNINITQTNGTISISTSDTPTFSNITVKDGKDGTSVVINGKDGTIGANGKDGTGVVLNGKDGTIGINGKNGVNATLTVAEGQTTVNPKDKGQNITRIVYNTTDKDGNTVTREVATLDDGLKFKGDNDTVINRTLGSQLNITGGADTANLTDNNIGVVGNANGDLVLKLNKNLNLTKDGSVVIGNSTLNDGGLTINGGPSIKIDGINAGDKKITNVAAGDISKDSKDAVNGGQLYSVIADTGFNLASKQVTGTNGVSSVDANLADADKRVVTNETFNLDAGNNIVIKQIKDGYEVATAENVTFTNITVGKDGKDGTIGVNGKDGASVVLNGKDGSIGLTGPKGQDGKDGASANITVANGTGTLDENGKGGDGITRIVYNTTNADGSVTTREVATKDDGLVFQGDNGDVIKKKLGQTLNITGGVTEENKLTDNNIGVVSKDGNLTVKLSKDLNLTDKGTITIGDVNLSNGGLTINGGPSINKDGINAGDKKITNVADGNVSNGSKEAINGGQLYTAITNSGFNLTTKAVAGSNGEESEDANLSDDDKRIANNETFTLDAGNNLVIKQIANGYQIATSSNMTIGKDGKDGVDGRIGVNGKDGASVVLNGKDGSIGLTGPKGADGKSASANISVANGTGTLDENGKGGDGITRIVYNTTNADGTTTTREIATKDDGLVFQGDNGKAIKKKLGETLNITGGVTEESKLTDNNIGIINKDGNLTVKLSKDLNLTDKGTITIGDVNLSNGGLTINGGPSINKDGINAGDKKITNVADGNVSNGSKEAINGGQLYTAITNSGFNLTTKAVADSNGQVSADGLSDDDKRIATNETFTLDAGNNLVIKQIANGYEIATGNNITVGAAGKDGKPGVDGTIGVNGKDGASVVINGKDGSIGLTGPKGQDGKDGASATLQVVNGTKGLDGNDGKDGESKTRIEYVKPDGTKEEVATLKDGLVFKGDNDTKINRTLNSQLEIVGGAKEADLTDNNIGVIGDANGTMTIKLNKDLNLTDKGSVNLGGTVLNSTGLTITNGPSITKDGINAGDKKVTNVTEGTLAEDSKDAVNGSQLYATNQNITNVTNDVAKGWNITTSGNANGTSLHNVRMGDTVTLDAGNNINITQTNGTISISTSDTPNFANVTVGKDGQNGIDGTIGVNGKDGASVVLNGKDGSIGLTGPKGADGKSASANITVANGTGTLDENGKGGDGIERIVYNTTNKDGSVTTREIATKDDGLVFKGDNGKAIKKKLGETLNITGGVTEADKLTDNNIGVVNKDGNLTVKLSKDLNLTDKGSVTIGNVSISSGGIDLGNTTITNLNGNLDKVDNTTTSNPDQTGNKYENITNNAATVGDVLNAGWNLQANGNAVDFVTHGNTVNFNNGTGVAVNAVYNATTGATNITFNTTNSYIDENGALTNTPSNKVKFIGANNSAPVLITNVDSGVLPQGTSLPTNVTFNEYLNNLTGDALNNVVNAGDLKNATQNITKDTLSAVGFNLKSAIVAGSNGAVSEQDGLTEADKRLTNNETFNLNAGNNIVIKQIANGYEVATSNNITVGAAGKDGKDGVDGTIGVNGKDGSAVVINGKDGSIGLNGKDGANGLTIKGGQGPAGVNGKDGETTTRIQYVVNGTTENVANLNDGLKFKGDNDQVINRTLNSQLNIVGGAQEANLTANNIGVIGHANGTMEVKLNKDLNLTKDGSITLGNTTLKDGNFTMGNVTINNDGLTIKDGPSITNKGIDAGNKVITNVANGTNATDAVNLSQLNASTAAAKTEVQQGKNVVVTNTTAADGHTIYTVNAEKSVVTGSNAVNVTTTVDKANFTTSYNIDLSDEMKKQIGKEESVTAGDSNIKVVANGTNASGGKNFDVSLNKDLNLTKDGSVTIGGTSLTDGNVTVGNTTLNNDGLAIKNGPSITNEGINAGNKKVTNVADGDISPNSKDAINGSQLYTSIANSGFNLATNGEVIGTDKRINNNETFTLNQGKNIVVKQIDNGYEVSTANNFIIGEKGEPGKDGVDGTIGVNGKDGSSVVINGKDGSIGLTGPKGADGKNATATIRVIDGQKGLDGNDGKDGESKTRIEYTKQDGSKEQVATLNDGLEFMGDSGTVSKQKLNSRVNVVGGQADESKLSSAANIGVVSDGKGKLTVKLAKDIDLGKEGSVAIGNTTVNNNGLVIKGSDPKGTDTVSVTDKGISAGNKVISNVAPGVKPTDAVNKGQLDQVRGDIYNVNNRVDNLDKRVRGIGANAAAASSLPQVYMPGKSMVAAAAGGYSGASAIAVGYSRASDNGKVILKLTGTANSAGHYSGGVGVGYQW